MRAVQEVHAGEASLDHAVDVLLELEARYRIGVHTDFGGLAGGGEHLAWRLRPGQPPLPLGELVGPAWRVTATREIVEQRYELRDDDLTEVEYRERLFPFLSDTQLLLSGGDFAEWHFLTIGDDVAGFWSQRMWGHALADWARWSGWAARHGIEVSYTDFYTSGSQLIEGYAAFERTARACIRRKTIRLVGPELPPWDADQRVLRTWKRAIGAAGKSRVLAVIAPVVIEALDEILSSDIGDPQHRERFGDPRERADAAASAIELLRRGGASAEVNVPEPTGMTAPAMGRMNAAARLARAVQDKSKFERTVMDCLHSLWSVRPDLVDRVRAEL